MAIDFRDPIPPSFGAWFQAVSPNNFSDEDREIFLRGAAELYKSPMLHKVLGVMEAQALESIRLCPLEAAGTAEQYRRVLVAVDQFRGNLETFAQEYELMQKDQS